MTVDKNTFRSFIYESRIYFNQFLSCLVLNTPSWHIFIQISVDGLAFSPLNCVLYNVSFVLYSCDGMRTCLWNWAADKPIVYPPCDIWVDMGAAV
jgi:hypothetical protein